MKFSKLIICLLMALTLLCFLAPMAGAAGGPTNYPGSGAPWNSQNPGDGTGWDSPPGWSDGDTDLITLGIIFHV